jgi:murein DD-endopeptidase MepM/ murein hydrolase activator NlpD
MQCGGNAKQTSDALADCRRLRLRTWIRGLWLFNMREMREKTMVHSALLLLLLAPASSMFAGNVRSATAVTWQPANPVRGSAVLFQVSTPRGVRELSGRWFGRELKFSPLDNKGSFYALAGIPIETAPGSYDLELNGLRSTGTFHLLKKVRIGQARYPRVAITVAKQFTEPNPEQLKQIDADKQIKQAVFSKTSEAQLWHGDFRPPAEAPTSGVFGTERVFNGRVQSRHLGLDYAVPSGTPIRAINHGRVLLAEHLYFEGGFIVIDHGRGLMSLYLHLSDFMVKEGDVVAAGQVIASSGGSGRATGPHLHLAVRWQGIYLDPAVVLRLQVPKYGQ